MQIMAIELQKAGISFVEVRARHQRPPLTTHVELFIARTESDLELFKAWAFKHGVTAPNPPESGWRVATQEEIKKADEWC